MFDFEKISPEYRVHEISDDGIHAITFDALPIDGNKTKIFAFLGFPENEGNEKVPGVVLVHGGGGHPIREWVNIWVKRGYAAIAIETTGHFPIKASAAGHQEGDRDNWAHAFGDFAEDGYVLAPNRHEDLVPELDLPLEKQWFYHGLASVSLARRVLAHDHRVDSARIGLTGISWGGVLASLAICYDGNFAFAIPVYGSGYIGEGVTPFSEKFRLGAIDKRWLAEYRLNRVTIPIMWLCWNSDTILTLNSNSRSYLDTYLNNKNTVLSIRNEMGHSHYRGWVIDDIYLFADSIVKGTPGFGDMRVIRRRYFSLNASIAEAFERNGDLAKEWRITDTLPEDAIGHYIEYTGELDGREYVFSSPYTEKRP